MARPIAKNPLSEAMRVRLNVDEKRAFSRFAEKLKERPSRVMRRMIREAVTGGPDFFDDGLSELRQTHRQLTAIGRNLNQLTKLAHQGEALVPSDLAPELAAIQLQVRDAAKQYQAAVARARSRTVRREKAV